jgi:four helix bundle protein
MKEPVWDMKLRTRQFALKIIHLTESLPRTRTAAVIGSQVLRSGASVGAHYAEASRAKSRNDFLSKVVGATQELEETLYWIDLAVDSGLVASERAQDMQQEASQLMSILVTMAKRTKENQLAS